MAALAGWRPFLTALLVSLVLHLAFLGYNGDLERSATLIDPPIQARMVASDSPRPPPVNEPMVRAPSAPAKPKPVPKVNQERPPGPGAPQDAPGDKAISPGVENGEEGTQPEPHESVATKAPDDSLGAGNDPPVLEPMPVDLPEPTPAGPERPVHRPLPERIVIRYAIHYGQDQFKAGEAQYQWYQGGGSYTLAASAETTGLISLFVSGRIIQNSEGRVGPGGLAPLRYSVRQGEKRQDMARFEREQNNIFLSRKATPVSMGDHIQAQDLLSFVFHLAMTAREDEAPFDLGISDGRKYQIYRFSIKGVERLVLDYGAVDTLLLEGRQADGGVLGVWLERGGHGLPLQIRTLDAKGTQIVLKAVAVEM